MSQDEICTIVYNRMVQYFETETFEEPRSGLCSPRACVIKKIALFFSLFCICLAYLKPIESPEFLAVLYVSYVTFLTTDFFMAAYYFEITHYLEKITHLQMEMTISGVLMFCYSVIVIRLQIVADLDADTFYDYYLFSALSNLIIQTMNFAEHYQLYRLANLITDF